MAGRLADPTIAYPCPSAAPTFVVDAILEVYQQNIPEYMQVPDLAIGTDSWLRYTDTVQGYSLLYPPDWHIEMGKDDQGLPIITVQSPQFPNYPIQLRVYSGETYYDPYDGANSPELVRNGSVVQQNFMQFTQEVASQGLWTVVSATRAIFIGGGYTYELSLHDTDGMPQSMLDTLIVMVAGFRLDKPSSPSPITIAQSIDQARTYLEQGAAIEQVQQMLQENFVNNGYEVIKAQLLSEQQSRLLPECSHYQGHPGAIWDIVIRGKSVTNGRFVTINIAIEAETGNQLCLSSEWDQIQPFEITPTIDALTATAIEQSKALTPGITPAVMPPEPTPAATWPPNSGPSPVPPTVTRTLLPKAP